MEYRKKAPVADAHPSEVRADLAEVALKASTDLNGELDVNDTCLDVSDLLANLRHFCDRAGLDYGELDRSAYNHYSAERHSDGNARRDLDRFPG